MATKKFTDLPAAASVTLDDIVAVTDLAGPTSQKASLTVVRTAMMPAVLTADVSGILPAANGGTGAAALPAGGLAGLTDITNERSTVRTLTNTTIAGASNTLTVRIANDVSGLAAGVATWCTTPSSANLLTAMTDKSGTGLCVFDTAPLFKTTVNVNNPANTFKYVITPAAIVADRILNIPLLTATDTMVVTTLAQTLASKTLTAPIMTTPRVQTRLDIDNTGNTFQYQITPAALAANRILNLPLMTGTDTFVLNDFTATLTNKTINLTSNTLTCTSLQLKTACTDETGSGALVFATSPTLTTPVINGQIQGPAVAIAALAIDWTLGTVFTKTLAGGANTFTFSNQASGMTITVRVTGAASTLTWPTVKWAAGAAPTQTASGTDVYTFVHDGTSVYGSVVQAMA